MSGAACELAMLPERTLQDVVIAMARERDYDLIHHPTWLREGDAGFPDLVLVSTTRHRCLFVELKRTGRGLKAMTDAQFRWFSGLRAAGCEAFLWDWADYESGFIERVLERSIDEMMKEHTQEQAQ